MQETEGKTNEKVQRKLNQVQTDEELGTYE